MGVIGTAIGSQVGKHAGAFLGSAIGKKFGNKNLGEDVGRAGGMAAGGVLGAALPFKKGGYIPGKRGKAKIILGHSGEFILANGIEPTRSQLQAVKKLGGRYKYKC